MTENSPQNSSEPQQPKQDVSRRSVLKGILGGFGAMFVGRSSAAPDQSGPALSPEVSSNPYTPDATEVPQRLHAKQIADDGIELSPEQKERAEAIGNEINHFLRDVLPAAGFALEEVARPDRSDGLHPVSAYVIKATGEQQVTKAIGEMMSAYKSPVLDNGEYGLVRIKSINWGEKERDGVDPFAKMKEEYDYLSLELTSERFDYDENIPVGFKGTILDRRDLVGIAAEIIDGERTEWPDATQLPVYSFSFPPTMNGVLPGYELPK